MYPEESGHTQQDVLTVSQLTGLIKTMLEGSFPSIQIKGEISNFKANASGHLYFVLKDAESQISAVMFRGRAAALAFQPRDGMLVQARGGVSVYGPRGNYQLIVTAMQKAGAGDIMEMLEERKRRLAAEGLFDSRRKRELPAFPRTVGIVTSPTGAALRDFLQIARRRNPRQSVTVLPSLVQGEGAAESIVRMIRAANEWKLCDILVVGRGGGSLEDLLPFSDEAVVRAVAASGIPVVSAVGHEIDWALSDYAADMRAPTPSAAAELAVPQLSDIITTIESSRAELISTIENRVRQLRLMLRTFTPENMELQFRRIEQPLMQRFDAARQSLTDGMERLLADRRATVARCMQVLEACDPQTILNRGYSMVTDAATGTVIRSPADAAPGSRLIIRPARGTLAATVEGALP